MLTDAERQTQKDIAEAYRWVFRVSEESGALLNDAERLMSDRGLEDAEGLMSYYGKKVPPDSWPCVYYLGRSFRAPSETAAGNAVFLAVSVGNPRSDFVPSLLAGAVRWTGEDADSACAAAYYAVADAGHYRRFAVAGEGVRTATPSVSGAAYHKGIQELRFFSLPLAWISSPERLVRLVEAIVALRAGSDQPARALLAEIGT